MKQDDKTGAKKKQTNEKNKRTKESYRIMSHGKNQVYQTIDSWRLLGASMWPNSPLQVQALSPTLSLDSDKLIHVCTRVPTPHLKH